MSQFIKRRTTTIPFILFILFIIHSQLFSQQVINNKVSIKASHKPLHLVLDDLTDQTGYFFTFDSRLTDSRKPITLNLSDITIQKAIDTLFQDSSLSYKIINNNIVIVQNTGIGKQDELRDVSVQNHIREINGLITDIKSEKPLTFATISVFDTYYGTISNEDGSFRLRIPDSLKQIILVSSYMGYKNQYTPVSLNSKDPVEIKMNKTFISIQEVIIRNQDPVSLLSESIKKFKQNYMSEPSGMTAYYREKVQKDDKCMLFSEAIVEIAKAPYTNSISTERSRIIKGRKIANIDIQDTVIFRIKSGLNSLLQLDIVKNPPDFLSSDFNLNYDLHFSNVVSFKDKLVYVISFNQKESIQELLFKGDIYIDRETLAIIAADFEYDPLRIQSEENMFVAKKSKRIRVHPISTHYHVEYSMTDGAYRLSLVQGEVKFKVRKRRQWIASRYHINIEMAVTNINPGNPPNIKYNQQIKPASIISDQVFEYDPDFWGDYTTIVPENSLSDALKKIGKSLLEISTSALDNQ